MPPQTPMRIEVDHGSRSPAVAIDCPVCKAGRLTPHIVYWLYGSAVTVGYLLLVLGLAGALASVFRQALANLQSARGVGDDYLTSAAYCLAAAFAGYLLTLRRHVLWCSRCQAIFPTA